MQAAERILTRRDTSMPVRKLHLEYLEPKMTGMFHMVSVAGYASVATWQTNRFSSTSLSCYEHPRSSVRKTHQASWFPWT
jgi:hypothetical protein